MKESYEFVLQIFQVTYLNINSCKLKGQRYLFMTGGIWSGGCSMPIQEISPENLDWWSQSFQMRIGAIQTLTAGKVNYFICGTMEKRKKG